MKLQAYIREGGRRYWETFEVNEFCPFRGMERIQRRLDEAAQKGEPKKKVIVVERVVDDE